MDHLKLTLPNFFVKQTIVYILLLVVISLGYIFSKISFGLGTLGIVGLSAIKFLMISFFFMGMHRAATFWKIIISMIVLIFVCINLI
ncbi:MAG: hypothetical protein O9264_15920 [Leptospira sp.]|nr:hypothetical protein [Leptospira sp.]